LVEGYECLRTSLPSKPLLKEKFGVTFIISDINHIKLVLARSIHNQVLCCVLWLLLLLMMTLFSTLLLFAISKSFCSLALGTGTPKFVLF
jgi:ABC-type bacteriocin/lantibiotic exporter with double-glycine peptidase domain